MVPPLGQPVDKKEEKGRIVPSLRVWGKEYRFKRTKLGEPSRYAVKSRAFRLKLSPMPASKSSSASALPSESQHADVAPVRFEEAMAELERLVEQMESGQLPLEAMLKAYERGASLIGVCRERLSAIEHQVQLLDGEVLKQLDGFNGQGEAS